jgi:hypothetical protein
MGKAKIISEYGDGKYRVEVLFDDANTDSEITKLDARIADLAATIAAMADGTEKSNVQLSLNALRLRKNYIQSNFPENYETDAWCVDYTTGLAVGSYVGTIEVPGEIGDIYIHPGYVSNTFDYATHGQMNPNLNIHSVGTYLLWSILPGWQKFMPTFRTGTITAIDTVNNQCDVTLDAALSSAQSLDINQTGSLSAVDIDYMDCDHEAFAVDDGVVVQFVGQDWNSPKVIGFKSNPSECGWTEPWNGPAITSKWPWEYSKYATLSDSTIWRGMSAATQTIIDGVFNITIPDVDNSGFPTKGFLEYGNWWKYQPGAAILPSASKIKFKGTAIGDCDWSDLGGLHRYFACIILDGNGKKFSLFLHQNSEDHYSEKRVGCSDLVNETTDWIAYDADSWVKNIAAENDIYIDLPIAAGAVQYVAFEYYVAWNGGMAGNEPTEMPGIDATIDFIGVI